MIGSTTREGSAMIARHIALADELAAFEVQGTEVVRVRDTALDVCDCGETRYRGRCHNVGACRDAERSAVRQSLVRGTAASARPAAWSLGGRVD